MVEYDLHTWSNKRGGQLGIIPDLLSITWFIKSGCHLSSVHKAISKYGLSKHKAIRLSRQIYILGQLRPEATWLSC